MTDGERDPATEFGVELDAAMKVRRWGQRELARRSGVSQQTVANMLRGHKAHAKDEPWRPSEDSVRKVAAALEESADTWLRRAGYVLPDRSAAVMLEAQELAEQFRELEPHDREALRRLVVSLLEKKGYIHSRTAAVEHGEPRVPVYGRGESAVRDIEAGPPEISEESPVRPRKR